MNKKKKVNIKRPDCSELVAMRKDTCEPMVKKVSPYWQRLPAFHQKALQILVPVTFVLILLPSGAEEELESIQPTMIPAPEMERQSVSLNLEGLSEQEVALRDAPSAYEVEQEKEKENSR